MYIYILCVIYIIYAFIYVNKYFIYIVIYIIILQSSIKVFSTTRKLHRMISSSVKTITGVTL